VAKKKKDPGLTPQEEKALDTLALPEAPAIEGLSGVDALVEADAALAELPGRAKGVLPDEVLAEPAMTDPGWHDFVMKQFAPDELDEDGRPFVTGLRRVARKLLGPILESAAEVVCPPQFVQDAERGRILGPATVHYRLTFNWSKLDDGEGAAYPVTFTDCADVFFGNTDPEYARHASATAATRAEARCYRKALQLKRTIAAEEATAVPVEESGVGGKITASQITFLKLLAERTQVDLMKFVNSGRRSYDRLEDIPYDSAREMNRVLSEMFNGERDTPEAIKL
jgi:hypothetical protein